MKTYLRILSYAKPYWLQIILHAVFIILAVIMTGLTFRMMQPLLEFLFYKDKITNIPQPAFSFSIDYIQKWVQFKAAEQVRLHDFKAGLLFVSLTVIVLNVFGNIFRYFSAIYLAIIRTKVIENIRKDVFYNLVNLHIGYIENKRKGDLLTRITSDVIEIEQSVATTFEAILRDPFTIVFFLVLMVGISWQLTVFIFLIVPITAVVISFISKSLKKDAFDSQNQHGFIMSTVDETISGIRVVKAFSAEKLIRSIFDGFNQSYSYLNRKQWYKKAIAPGFSESSGVIMVGIVIWYGGILVHEGKMEAAAFISYIALVSQIIRPAKSFSQAFGNIYKGVASGERVFELMDVTPQIRDVPNPVPLKKFKDKIVLKNVSFSYTEELVLNNINLTIEKGKMYGLVGPSGGGKSTLSELILRFYDVKSGSITFDGVSIKDISQQNLRDLMAVVTQEPILFNDTIYNNIVFGTENVDKLAVIEAAKAANAHEFILETAQGYETIIGDRGNLLSGGQKQRISIARAILKNPPILILDEATSALDTNSERIVQDAINLLMQNRTSIVIAHRLSTIQDADAIIVIDKGAVVQFGTHNELIEKEGMYKNLFLMQKLGGKI